MKTICIDFQGGAHGNFLEFVCNLTAGVLSVDRTPFNKLGAAHNKKYIGEKIFHADHYSFLSDKSLISSNVIAIKIDTKDLLPLSQISLLRAGNFGYDNNVLEVDTFNKLNNRQYKWVLDQLLDSFFTNQIKESYDAVKDPSWPDITNLEEFNNLHTEIKTECIEIHKLELLELTETNPNCPRHILREFFQIGFMHPESHGFMIQQNKMKYPSDTNVYEFPFEYFYDTNQFVNEIKQIARWASLSYNDWEKVIALHQEFLELQPYKNSKIKCDNIVENIIKGKPAPQVNLIEEAYINARLTQKNYECRY